MIAEQSMQLLLILLLLFLCWVRLVFFWIFEYDWLFEKIDLALYILLLLLCTILTGLI